MTPDEIKQLESQMAVLQIQIQSMIKYSPDVKEFVEMDAQYRDGLEKLEKAKQPDDPTEE